jgi:hypothetical protein
VSDAVPPEKVGTTGGADPSAALALHMPVRELSPDEAVAVGHGRPLPGASGAQGPVALVAGGALVAVARPDGAGGLRPHVVVGTPA